MTDIREAYIRLQTDLLVIGDSIMTDRHHASNGNYDADDPQNQIGGIIPAFTLSGWLRHGMETVIREKGATACHPGEPNANFMRADLYERDLDAGYHEKGTCAEDSSNDAGCIIFDLFGGFESVPGTLMRRPIKFNPVRASVDYSRGQAEGHYRRLNRNVVSRNESDGREALRNVEVDAVGNLDGTWHLTFRELKPEFLGLLHETIELLNDRNAEFMHQLGGARNFGGGIVYSSLINPLYDESELMRVFDRGKRPTSTMEEKDETWTENHLPELNDAIDERIEERR